MARPVKEISDWELIDAVRKGNTEAFERLVVRYQRQIANIVHLSLGSRLDAEDLTQETFYRLFQTIPHLEPRDTIFPWLYRTAINLCIDESRKRSIRRVFSLDFLLEQGRADAWVGDASQAADAGVLSDERRSRALDALGRVPIDQRIVLLMRDFEDLTYQDIADVLSISVASVKTRLFRARTRLKSIVSGKE